MIFYLFFGSALLFAFCVLIRFFKLIFFDRLKMDEAGAKTIDSPAKAMIIMGSGKE